MMDIKVVPMTTGARFTPTQWFEEAKSVPIGNSTKRIPRRVRMFCISSFVGLLSGCASLPSSPSVPSPDSVQLTGSTNQQVSTILQRVTNRPVNHIHVLSQTSLDQENFIFASYEDGGQTYFLSAIGNKDGSGSQTFQWDNEGQTKRFHVNQLKVDGYTYIVGTVGHDLGIQRVILTFSDGTVHVVPVQNGYFTCVLPKDTSATEHDAVYKSILGVTAEGKIISN